MTRNGNKTPRIKQWRETEGLTQEQAAERLGIHRVTLAKLETWAKPVGWELAQKVAEATGQRVGDIIEEYHRNARRTA